MRDPLLDELATLFDEIDPAPEVPHPRPTGFVPMELEAVRGVSQQLSFHHGTTELRLLVEDDRLVGLTSPGVGVHVHRVASTTELRSGQDGWFRTRITPGPLCVTLPERGLTTGWFVA